MESIRNDLKNSEWMTSALRRPSQLQTVGTQAYWVEGTAIQELYSCDVTSSSPPVKLIGSKVRTGELTIEEEMERERTRSRAVGIDSYHVSTDNAQVFYRSNGKWYLHNIEADVSMEVFASFDGVPTNVSVMNKSTMCEVSFTCGGNVYLGHLTLTGHTLSAVWTQITHIGGSNDVICGEADYIIAEEFGRLTGHWTNGDNVLFTVSDQSRLEKVHIFGRDPNVVEKMPYPRVGDENPTVMVCNYNTVSKKFSYLPSSTLMIDADSSSAEYIPRLGFYGDSSVYVQTLSRSQEASRVLVVPIDSFIEAEESELRPLSLLATPSVPSTTISEDSIPFAWVEITNALKLQVPMNGAKGNLMGKHAIDNARPYFHLFVQSSDKWEQLTTGDFNVNPAGIAVVGDNVLYMAGAHNYLGSTACVTSISTKTTTLISEADEYVYACTPVKEGDVVKGVVFVAGTATTCPTLVYYNMDTKTRTPIPTGWNVGYTSDSWPKDSECRFDLAVPKIFSTTNSRGVRLPFYVYTPNGALFSGKRPVLMYVYGGPHVQFVKHGLYDSIFNPLVQAAVNRGITCIVADNSMCHANDLRELSVCKRNMGRFETDDYVSIVKSTENIPELDAVVDRDRVAISGWSYGGYATLLAMSQASNVFKLGFAGAPVGDWRLYDTGYTERYMGLIPTDDAAYTAGSIATFANGFPDEPLRLFIAHGLTDENVHFTNSCLVVDALTAKGKPFQLQVYPGERHGLRQKPHSFNHYRSQMLATLLKLL